MGTTSDTDHYVKKEPSDDKQSTAALMHCKIRDDSIPLKNDVKLNTSPLLSLHNMEHDDKSAIRSAMISAMESFGSVHLPHDDNHGKILFVVFFYVNMRVFCLYMALCS